MDEWITSALTTVGMVHAGYDYYTQFKDIKFRCKLDTQQYDGLGSVIALSDSSGDTVETYQYDVYGMANQTSSLGNPYLFTGRQYDPETGLYYYRARFYSPAIGRFMQVDAIGYEDSMNLYIYVGNNPTNLLDPMGLCGEKSWYEKIIPFADVGVSGGLGIGKGWWGGFGETVFIDVTPESWRDIVGVGPHGEGGIKNVGAGVSCNWQVGVLYGAEDVSEAKGLAGIVAVDLDIKGGIAITFAANPDFKMWSISVGPGVGGDVSVKGGGIHYFPIAKPLREIFGEH